MDAMHEMPPAAVTSARPVEIASTAASEVADLGVLLVHGIGEQSQGETLSTFAEPVIDWIRDWLLGQFPANASIASEPLEARLRPPLLAADTPAHARVLIGRRREGGKETQQWLFAEAWWSPQVLTPPLASFTGWLLTRVPWLLLFHLGQSMPTIQRLPHPWSRLWPWRIDVPLQLAFGALVTPLWLLLSLGIDTLLVVASTVALVPLGRVRRTVFALLRSLAGVVGDAYVLLRNPVQRAAFEKATLQALEWLRPRCRKIAVVAHSQGAAVAHGTLRQARPSADLLITVGSGIAKLEALRHFDRFGAADRACAALAPLFLLGAAVVALRSNALGFTGIGVLPSALGIGGVSCLLGAWMSVRDTLAAMRRDSAQLALPDSLRWCDIAATHDPVPQGELTKFFDLPIHARPVPVLRSRIHDHTNYWNARAAFLPVIVEELDRCAGGNFLALGTGDSVARFAAARRVFHVDLRVLQLAKSLDAAAVLLPLFVHDRLVAQVERLRSLVTTARDPGSDKSPFAFVDEAMSRVEQALRWSVDVADGGPAEWARSAVDMAAAVALLLLALRLWQRMTFAMWRSWSASRNEAVLRPAAEQRKPDARPAPAREKRTRKAMMWLILDVPFLVLLSIPFALSAAWSLWPEWLGEANVYWALARLVGGLFALVLCIAFFESWEEQFHPWAARWRGERQERDSLRWPQLHAAAVQVLNVAVSIGLLIGLIGTVLTLPRALEVFMAIAGMALILRFLVALMNRIWNALVARGASTRRRAAVMALGPGTGVAAAALLALAVVLESPIPSLGTMLGGMAGIAVLGAFLVGGGTLLVLRWTRKS